MKKPGILNDLNVLQKVVLGDGNSILFYFGDIPNWKKKDLVKDATNLVAHYEVVEIVFDLDSANLNNLYWKLHRYKGEELFLQLKNGQVSIWQGEASDHEEYWSSFDDFEDAFSIVSHKIYNVKKSAEDWKNDYENLLKSYYSLYLKKKIQLDDFREKIKIELKGKIEQRIVQKINHKKLLNEDDINQILDLALNDLHNGVRVDLYDDFLYD